MVGRKLLMAGRKLLKALPLKWKKYKWKLENAYKSTAVLSRELTKNIIHKCKDQQKPVYKESGLAAELRAATRTLNHEPRVFSD